MRVRVEIDSGGHLDMEMTEEMLESIVSGEYFISSDPDEEQPVPFLRAGPNRWLDPASINLIQML
jgi:hypothetical protein